MTRFVPGRVWRFLAHRLRPGKGADGRVALASGDFVGASPVVFDELVIDRWFHIEQMSSRSWWFRIGDGPGRIDFNVTIDPRERATLMRMDTGELLLNDGAVVPSPLPEPSRPCRRCNDTGVWETGNKRRAVPWLALVALVVGGGASCDRESTVTLGPKASEAKVARAIADPPAETASFASVRAVPTWEALPRFNGGPLVARSQTPGGWIVVTWWGDSSALVYVPDPEHAWGAQ